MKADQVGAALERMVEQPGIDGCALVDASTGLVWHAAGHTPSAGSLWEAAVDYWRLYDRQSACFTALGALGAAVMYHRAGVLAVLPCCSEPNLLLVAYGRHAGVDWLAWQRRTRELGALVASTHKKPDLPAAVRETTA